MLLRVIKSTTDLLQHVEMVLDILERTVVRQLL